MGPAQTLDTTLRLPSVLLEAGTSELYLKSPMAWHAPYELISTDRWGWELPCDYASKTTENTTIKLRTVYCGEIIEFPEDTIINY
jgi:hypothetical protein